MDVYDHCRRWALRALAALVVIFGIAGLGSPASAQLLPPPPPLPIPIDPVPLPPLPIPTDPVPLPPLPPLPIPTDPVPLPPLPIPTDPVPLPPLPIPTDPVPLPPLPVPTDPSPAPDPGPTPTVPTLPPASPVPSPAPIVPSAPIGSPSPTLPSAPSADIPVVGSSLLSSAAGWRCSPARWHRAPRRHGPGSRPMAARRTATGGTNRTATGGTNSGTSTPTRSEAGADRGAAARPCAARRTVAAEQQRCLAAAAAGIGDRRCDEVASGRIGPVGTPVTADADTAPWPGRVGTSASSSRRCHRPRRRVRRPRGPTSVARPAYRMRRHWSCRARGPGWCSFDDAGLGLAPVAASPRMLAPRPGPHRSAS